MSYPCRSGAAESPPDAPRPILLPSQVYNNLTPAHSEVRSLLEKGKGLPGPFGKAEEGSCLASPGPKWEHKYVPGQPDPDGLDYGVY